MSQVIFQFAINVGMIVLTGTTNTNHMREDLVALEFRLKPNEVKTIEKLASTIRIAN